MKTKFEDILDREVKTNFLTNTKIYDLGRQAEIVQKIAEKQIAEDGEFAKIHCSNIVDWMQDIVEIAQKALDIQLEKE